MRNNRSRLRIARAGEAAKATGSPQKFQSWVWLTYLVVSAAVFFAVQLSELASHRVELERWLGAVAAVFPIVDNTRHCATLRLERYALVGCLVVLSHVVTLTYAWHVHEQYRAEDDKKPFAWPTVRGSVSDLATLLLSVAFYWFTFFAMTRPILGSPASSSYLCWNLGTVWLLYSFQSIFSISIVMAVAFAIRSGLRRSWHFLRTCSDRGE